MTKEDTTIAQKKKFEELHWQIQQWKSNFQFMDDEILFINRLLDSNAFRPNTPNLFERIQDFKNRINKISETNQDVQSSITLHENHLGGILECSDVDCDLSYYQKQDKLQTKIDSCLSNFRQLKSEIFNYTGGILN